MIKCMVFVCSLERSVGLTLTKNKLFFDGERGEYTPGLCQPVSYYIITDILSMGKMREGREEEKCQHHWVP